MQTTLKLIFCTLRRLPAARLLRLALIAALLLALLGVQPARPARAYNTTDISPPVGSGTFGSVEVLPNGNLVVVDYHWDDGATLDVGAVYLYDGSSLALISSLTGSTAGDQVGGGGVTVLSSGNYVVRSDEWDNGSAVDAGAVTWCSGTNGCSGPVSPANSLVGSKTDDWVGSSIIPLNNGNYVVESFDWDNGSAVNAGAATWCSGASGCSGPVSAANSLVGSTTDDWVGYVTPLSNGHYVVRSYYWDNGAIVDAGAVTWCSGDSGCSGAVSAANSLVGSKAGDAVGDAITELAGAAGSNYVVNSPDWDNGAIVDAGAATWCSGDSGCSGAVSPANSLVGSKAGDQMGHYIRVTVLSNGNYVFNSPDWDNGAIVDAGAVTWCSGASGCSGVVSIANSLVGSTAGDQVGKSIVPLSNGNYVVRSNYWDNGAIVDAGAATWCSGDSGCSGAVSAANSLVGSTTDDQVGSSGITALSNDNYVVRSTSWDNAAIQDVGAATWGSGLGGTVGAISAANSLVGSDTDDWVGDEVTALSNGNYVVGSPGWDNGFANDAGAVTWGDGLGGTVGAVGAANSLVGSTTDDRVGGVNGIIALSNGNYVVNSLDWDNGSTVDAGAATWGNGLGGTVGAISTANSLVGSTAGDQVGADVIALSNGNYVVRSYSWDNGSAVDAGAVTWGNGAGGTVGEVGAANSLAGSTTDDKVGYSDVIALSNGNYVVSSASWHNGSAANAGAVTWGNGAGGTVGEVSGANSLVGYRADDWVGIYIIPLSNGNYVVRSPYWDNGSIVDAGAVSYGAGNGGTQGTITGQKSILGETASGGGSLDFAYNEFYEYLAVGRTLAGNNGVSLFRPTYTTLVSGGWNASTWDYGAFAQPQDVAILTGHTVTLGADASTLNFALNGQVIVPGGFTLNINSASTFRGAGSLSQETRLISGSGLQSYPVAEVTADVTTQGSLASLMVARTESPHPQENSDGQGNKRLDRYYTFTPDAGGYTVNICAGYTEAELGALVEDNLRLCRWSGSAWGCLARGAGSSTAANRVCADGVTTFSDWVLSAGEEPSTLTANTAGSGSVTLEPQQTSYAYGEVVTLTAAADTGWVFTGWSGDLGGSTNPAALTMDGDKSVTATFELLPPSGQRIYLPLVQR